MQQILDKVLNEIKPSKEEELERKKKIDLILKKIKSKEFKAILGGSGAKGTWLKKVNDADIFVCFNYPRYKDKSDQISNILEKHLKKKFKKLYNYHGSRDYFQIRDDNFTYEIVPILEIKKPEQAKNITDISPLHAKWVTKYKKFKDDILLTKQFCKANNIYGAESHINGFSGYICEIITIHYKGFLNLLKAASRWNDKVIIDTERYHKGKDVIFELNKSKTECPLIVIDPVQASRNAAAAISIEKFEIFKKAAKLFLKSPSENLFQKKEFSLENLKKQSKNKNLVVLEFDLKQEKQDILGCKVIKVIDLIKQKLEKQGFTVYKTGFDLENDKAIGFLILKDEILEKEKIHPGPPLSKANFVSIFKTKYKKTFVKNKMIYAKVKRDFVKAEDLIISEIKNKFDKRIKSIRIKNV